MLGDFGGFGLFIEVRGTLRRMVSGVSGDLPYMILEIHGVRFLEFVGPRRSINHIFELSIELHGSPMENLL